MSSPAPKRLKFDFKEEIVVLVGPSESAKRLRIHEDVMCNQSSFFRAALSREFPEGQERLVRPPEVDPEIFSVYLQWVYSGKVVALSAADLDKDERGHSLRMIYTELYILADFLETPQLRNVIPDLMIKSFVKHRQGPGSNLVRRVWDVTRPNNKLRQLLLDRYVARADYERLEAGRETLPAAFFIDLAIEFANEKPVESAAEMLSSMAMAYRLAPDH